MKVLEIINNLILALIALIITLTLAEANQGAVEKLIVINDTGASIFLLRK